MMMARRRALALLAALVFGVCHPAHCQDGVGASCPALLLRGATGCAPAKRLPRWCLPAFGSLQGAQATQAFASAAAFLERRQRQHREAGMQPSGSADFLIRMWRAKLLRQPSQADMHHYVLHRGNALGLRMTKGLPDTDRVTELPRKDLPAMGTRFRRCAVIASSKSVLTRAHGRDIDAHDVVIRTNQAPTKGFEEHVGRRTTFRVTNGANAFFSEDGARTICLRDPDRRSTTAAQARQLHGRLPSESARCTPLTWSPQFMAYRWSTFPPRQTGGSKPKWSSGFTGLALAVNLCQSVSIYGFSWGAGGYYYRKRYMGGMNNARMQAAGRTASHPWAAEKACTMMLARTLPNVTFVE
eukprot:jgi/Tetstr1/448775/TSEL_036009.t1